MRKGSRRSEFACELNPDVANFHALTPFPPAPNLRQHRISTAAPVSRPDAPSPHQGAAFIPYSMKREDITALREIAFKRLNFAAAFSYPEGPGIRSPPGHQGCVQRFQEPVPALG